MAQQYGDTAAAQYSGDTATMTAPGSVAPDSDATTTQRYEEARAAAHRAMSNVTIVPDQLPAPTSATEPITDPDLLAYRGFKFGAAFFGWLISIAMSVLLLAAAAAAALGTAEVLDYSRADAEAQPGAAGITAASVVVLMVTLAFFTGGYVAGRLARFDGGRQGFGVWMLALLFSVLAAGAGAFGNSRYDWLDDLNRPDVALSNDTLAMGGIVAAATLVVLALLFAILGGKAGRRYHDKIDTLLD
ncbi:hypothetical protein E0H75_37870 [Kribbella capetownensis]|uniref:Uncharacterized protein n=1 Tax=Kribbella capetownensis TaxID=1572659 RepID=A0A4R0JLM5_9ACTN|nr:hypothetical protein [Kribbella capetownensis]TCC42785.1 hypothetical protein E0H75_37870 [Kribbella capetownensis]